MLSITRNTSTDQPVSGPNTRTNTPSPTPTPIATLFGQIPMNPNLRNRVPSLLLKKISSATDLNALDGIDPFARLNPTKKINFSL